MDPDAFQVRITVDGASVRPAALRYNQRLHSPCAVYSDAERRVPLLPFTIALPSGTPVSSHTCNKGR